MTFLLLGPTRESTKVLKKLGYVEIYNEDGSVRLSKEEWVLLKKSIKNGRL